MIELTNMYYFSYLNFIGGTETFLYYLIKKYKDYDITIVYQRAEKEQLERLQKYAKCIQYTGQKIKCKKAFFNYGMDIIDNVEAEDYYFVIHADYQSLMKKNPNFRPVISRKITKYIGVSEQACKSFSELMGVKCELCYNPLALDEPKRILNLVSATRLSREKGKERMIKLAKALDDAGIPYLWTVFTTDTNAIDNPNIVYMKPRLDINGYIKNADYLVQLSDSEGYCYSVVEALSMGVPVIVTPCPVFNEIGLEDKKNCYIVDFDMQNIPIEDIYNHIPKDFKYIPKKDRWNELFVLRKSSYVQDREYMYTVKALPSYKAKSIRDATLGRVPNPGETWDVDFNRMLTLTENNKYNTVFVEVVKKFKK